jgi:hypothetical protein
MYHDVEVSFYLIYIFWHGLDREISHCIFCTSFFKVGKELAVKGKTLVTLIGMLNDPKSEVRAAVAGALMRYYIKLYVIHKKEKKPIIFI